MDPADAPASEGVMIAFLPTTAEWSKLDLPHMTLVYCGTKSDLPASAFNEIAKDACSLAMITDQFGLMVKGVEKFGPPEDQVNALDFQPTTELWAMRRFVERWNKSEFPFNPHATIGPVTSFVDFVPRSVMFNRVYVGWGDESLTFRLKGSY